MVIDCDTCVVRGDACQDCVMSVLLAQPPLPDRGRGAGRAATVELGAEERRALDVLAEAGMVPRLRLTRHAG